MTISSGQRQIARVFAALMLVALCLARVPEVRAAAVPVPDPVVEGPVGTAGYWGHPHNGSFFTLDPYGYVEEEYFYGGLARPYVFQGEPTAYKTRMLVIRPANARRFNGTVVVEWLNISTGQDLPVEWWQTHEMLLREGYAYVGISAQSLSVTQLAGWDNQRYGSLRHGGDQLSYDVFSQGIQALRSPTGIDPLPGMRPDRVIATGISQSAQKLDEYLEYGVDAEANVIDAFLIERDVGRVTTLPAVHPPVINLASEESSVPVTTTEGPNFRLWQVAGAAHVEHWYQVFWNTQNARNSNHGPAVAGADKALAPDAGKYGEAPAPGGVACGWDGDLFPSRYASRAAISQLDRWIRRGKPATIAPPLEHAAPAGAGGVTIARDEYGNAKGGLRYPVVDVPVVTYIGNTCGISGGQTFELPPGALALRYPTHAAYVDEIRAATRRAVRDGILLPADARDLLTRAEGALVPR